MKNAECIEKRKKGMRAFLFIYNKKYRPTSFGNDLTANLANSLVIAIIHLNILTHHQ